MTAAVATARTAMMTEAAEAAANMERVPLNLMGTSGRGGAMARFTAGDAAVPLRFVVEGAAARAAI